MNSKDKELKDLLKQKKMKSLELGGLLKSKKKVIISLFRGHLSKYSKISQHSPRNHSPDSGYY